METIKSHQMHNRRLGGLSPFNPEKGKVRRRQQVVIGGVSNITNVPPRRRKQATSNNDLNRISYESTGLSIANTNQPSRVVQLLGGLATSVGAFGGRVADFFNKALERKRTLVPLSFVPVFIGAFSTLTILSMFNSTMETAKTNASDERISIQASARTFMGEGTGREVKSDDRDATNMQSNGAASSESSDWTSTGTTNTGTVNSFTGETGTTTETAPAPVAAPTQTAPAPAVVEPTSPSILPDITESVPIIDSVLNPSGAEESDPLIELGPIDIL